ncbi:MAG: hypothetical protein Q9184_002723 [Pyrenodesmia sp. 2 TL-2023]
MDFFQFGVTTDASNTREFTFRQPAITGKRAAIARAAHEAGFDCSNPSKLLHLIDAVVIANNQFGYPDRWDGPAAFQSSVYPDSWTPAHAARREKRQRNELLYDDEAKPASVPAYAISAKDIVRTLNRNVTSKPKGPTGANLAPLGERALNKRTATGQLPEDQSFKRPKVETPLPQGHLIDLTQDESLPPSRSYTARSNVSRTITATRGYHMSRQTVQQRAAEAHQAEAIAAGTKILLEDTAARLRASISNLCADREALRIRWEVDNRLQLLQITEHLKTLNDYFDQSAEGLRGSVDVSKFPSSFPPNPLFHQTKDMSYF